MTDAAEQLRNVHGIEIPAHIDADGEGPEGDPVDLDARAKQVVVGPEGGTAAQQQADAEATYDEPVDEETEEETEDEESEEETEVDDEPEE